MRKLLLNEKAVTVTKILSSQKKCQIFCFFSEGLCFVTNQPSHNKHTLLCRRNSCTKNNAKASIQENVYGRVQFLVKLWLTNRVLNHQGVGLTFKKILPRGDAGISWQVSSLGFINKTLSSKLIIKYKSSILV